MAARGRSREVCDKTARDYKFWPKGRRAGGFKLAEPAGLTGVRPRAGEVSGASCESIGTRPNWNRLFGNLILLTINCERV